MAPPLLEFLFLEGLLSLLDSRTSMSKEARLVSYWFLEQRKRESRVIVLSDIFDISFVDLRVRKLITHRVYPYLSSKYRVVSLGVGRMVGGTLGKGTIMGTIKESDKPFTKEELAKMDKDGEDA